MQKIMNKTCDISDALHPEVQYLEPGYQSFGGKSSFSGKIQTVKCFEDNSLVREKVFSNGTGCVLVVDAGASKRCAMLGDMLAEKAVENGWQGVVMNGLIRDSADINRMDIGVKSLGTFPLKSVKNGAGTADIELNFSGVRFTPGEYLYADEDGVIVIKEKV
jgi:regulator of ribonuclease activity A